MKIPEQLEVGGLVYSVEEHPSDSPMLNHGVLNGSQTKQSCEICLNNQLNQQHKEQTFTHETIHAICDVLSISGQNIEIDERFVESFSQILYQVIKQL